jgi:hypothetical protein
MQGAVEELTFTEFYDQAKPTILSHDSGLECSLDHWLEVHELVEEEYLLSGLDEGDIADWT